MVFSLNSSLIFFLGLGENTIVAVAFFRFSPAMIEIVAVDAFTLFRQADATEEQCRYQY